MPEGALLGLAMAGKDADPRSLCRALGATEGRSRRCISGRPASIRSVVSRSEETDDQQTQAAKMSWVRLAIHDAQLLQLLHPATTG